MFKATKRLYQIMKFRLMSGFKKTDLSTLEVAEPSDYSSLGFKDSPDQMPPSEDIYSPRQAFSHSIDFKDITLDGPVESNAEEWSRKGNSLHCDTRNKMTKTCSGLLAPLEALTAVCHATGKPAHTYDRCFRCGHTYCHLHCLGIRTRDGEFIFCKDCWAEELRNWQTLIEADGKLVPNIPPKPFCPASGSRVAQEVSHE